MNKITIPLVAAALTIVLLQMNNFMSGIFQAVVFDYIFFCLTRFMLILILAYHILYYTFTE